MGRAARWLRGLLGGKKSTEEDKQQHSSSSSKEKRRWGFGKSFRVKDKDKRGPPPPPSHYYSSSSTAAAAREDEDEQHNRRAIAMAAATAAVAEAAVAAAQAAAAVVRLTSNSGGGGGSSSSSRKREEWAAAVKIQAAFRAYLARRALRALRGLVKLQALVRGNIVRKQAAETLRCMQALVRVQARTRACRALRADRNHRSKAPRLHPGPSTPDKYEQAIRSKAMNSHHKRSSSHASGTTRGQDQEQAKYSGWNWLDRWMEERYWDGRELNKSGVAAMNAPLDDEKNAKILEIDTGKPNVRRKSSYHHSCSTAASDQNSRSFNTMPDSPSKDSTVVQRSIPSPSSVDMQSISPLRFPVVDGGNYFDSPHFFSASSRPGSSRREPFTPSKSECSRSFLSAYSDYPNYMANTESSRAKVRSQSAPKQRPDFEKSGSVRKVSGHGFPQPSAGPIQKSSSLHSQFANKAYPGSGRLDRLGMPIKI